MKIAIMDFNSVSIFIATVPEEEAKELPDSDEFDIWSAIDYINKKYDKHFNVSECHWMYIDEGDINIEIV
jgi:hypothetical protein